MDKINTEGVQDPMDLARYRTFSRLAADAVWELDAELCYRFHRSNKVSTSAQSGNDLIGLNRIEFLDDGFSTSPSLAEHHQQLLQRKPIDLVLTLSNQNNVQYHHVFAEPQFDSQGSFTGYFGCERDVTKRVRLESELHHLASHDDLTGVMNRRAFERALGVQLRQVKADGDSYTLCFIDLDRFKKVNDEGGHHAGDQLLRELVNVIRKHLLPEDTLARIGGDEFALLLKSDVACAGKVVDKIIDSIASYEFDWHSKKFRVGASVGIAALTPSTSSTESIMLEADNACYAAKSNGRNQMFLAAEKDKQLIDKTGRQPIANSDEVIKNALEKQQYKLLVQPIVSNLQKESFNRYEILLRLQCQNGELLEPGKFMPLAIAHGYQQEIDYWVVENALEVLQNTNAKTNDIAFTINLSAGTLASVDALDKLTNIFSRYEIPKNRICIDITESTAIRNLDAVFAFMDRLKSLGVEFALDDFGSSLSSLTYLHRLPINYLKFDGELIRRLSTDETVRSITASIAELARKLNIETIAESVEDSATAAYVKELEIDFMQGFGVASLITIESLTVSSDLVVK